MQTIIQVKYIFTAPKQGFAFSLKILKSNYVTATNSWFSAMLADEYILIDISLISRSPS